ncbi:MAG TPA: type II secretion system F family protein [Chloroflexota bacterium]|nr:type II secretion system F family protein [Chloroflexota bacterium]
MEQSVLVTVLVFLLVMQAALLATGGGVGEREVIARRLQDIALPTWQTGLPSTISILRRRRYSRLPWLDMVLTRFDLADGLSHQLQRAGVPLRAGEFLFLQLVLATTFALLGALIGWETFGGPVAALLAGFIGFCAPLPWLRMMGTRRVAAFEQGLPDALDRVTGALRAGYGLEYGFDIVAREMVGPTAEEFGQILQELNLGGDLEEALARMLDRVNSEDARLLSTAVAVQRRTGGNLVEVLGQMALMLRERERLRRDVRVITTAPRISGYVVALLPVLTMAVMYLTSRYYVEALLSSPIGRLAAIASAGLVVLGLFLNHRIAHVEL